MFDNLTTIGSKNICVFSCVLEDATSHICLTMISNFLFLVSSPVFEAMFKTDMEEKKTNRVEIVGYSVTVLKAMLEHIYKGKTDDLEEYSMELLEIAEKYDLVDLKTDCEIAVANSLTVSNAAQTLELAIRNNAESLRIETEEFVRR